MYVVDGSVVTSASDLKKASECEFAFLRELDVKLGRDARFAKPDDAVLERAGGMGTEHELAVLARYRQRFGEGVVEIAQPDVRDEAAVAAAVAATVEALAARAPVVYQAAFVDEGFIGFADFLVRQADGRYRVQDSKLARHARVTALLQLVAYAEQLDRLGVPCDDVVELLLGDQSTSEHHRDDIAPVYRRRVARLRQLVRERVEASGPVEWGDPRYQHDGRCPTCELEVVAHRDVLMVGGLRVTQREPLAAAGLTTIDALAASIGPVAGLIDSTVDGLRQQARLQLVAERAEAASARLDLDGPEAAGAAALGVAEPPAPPPYEMRDAAAIAAIPIPNPGDLFFDFEGDPLYTEGDATAWNLDYLWGMVDEREQYTRFWAHSFAAERHALERFIEFVKLRRQTHPGMHIYHYASYERTHLASIAARHGVCEADVDQLLADGVLVDLYPIVKRAVRVGSRSYSIKKLEPLYMGDELREADVKSGGDSILEYVRARQLMESGLPAELDEARRIFDDLADYNRYDCVSTRRLRDWLIDRAREAGIAPVDPATLAERPASRIYQASPLAIELRERAGIVPPGGSRDADHEALALASAAIDYHAREAKSFWWSHFLRLDQPVDTWEDHRDVLVIDPARSRVTEPWWAEESWSNPRRRVRLEGRVAPGSRFSVGGGVFLLYEWPAPFPSTSMRPGQRATTTATICEIDDDGLVVEESGVGDVRFDALPMALAPGWPPNTDALQGAIAQWATGLAAAAPSLPLDPATDVLRRLPPRVVGGLAAVGGLSDRDHDYVTAVTDSTLRLDSSYLAVQGPPGTGKTYVASHVIARLVADHGWRIGVVAQSHAVVEHVLNAVVRAGLDRGRVAKAVKNPDDGAWSFTPLVKKDHLTAFMTDRPEGFVVGGTAWDFSNTRRVPRRSLDLLVIDEAGQFSLASTIAVSVAARNLLLLGDPQQLPQVSQALHPEPVDTSALGWVADGHEVLPPEYGYFLAESRRMHPAVAAPVSRLAYENALESHPIASSRLLDGVEPGLHPVAVDHEGNTTASPEEASVVVDLVRSLLGRAWTDATEGAAGAAALPPRPLTEHDLIVVTPYNAQLSTVRDALDAAGFTRVPLGTVDKFQGQEAAVAIVSLAASSAAAAPRGIDFLLLKNRLNVAISRAKWAAYLVYSPGLLDALPTRPDGVARLSAFIRLVERDLPVTAWAADEPIASAEVQFAP